MQVILKKDIKGVGKAGQVINASDGYARNFLFPKNLAVEADSKNMQELKAKEASTQHKKELNLEAAKKVKEELKKIILNIKVKAGENGKIFGGVTSKDIAEELRKEHKIEIDKKKINLDETIKVLGVYTVEIKLDEGVIATLKINVINE